ncbi:MAG: TrmH family RNA methyltransferase [Treponema sp.]|nr:TrmH family RNA methyltransferase [Treponema sp.]
MIPLSKLAALPHRHRLRKIRKIFDSAERSVTDSLPEPLRIYLGSIVKFILDDGGVSPAAAAALEDAGKALQNTARPADPAVLRAVNTIRHLLLAETGRFPADWDFIDHGGRLDPAARRVFPGMSVYLEDIRSPFNIGAMFRTAESFGVEHLYLSPHCADPRHPRAERTAMGCVDILTWERLPGEHPETCLRTPFFALETGGVPLCDFKFPRTGVMIAGSEELGVSPESLALADTSLGRVTIPSYGAKGSLNVSAAFAIAMQAWAAALTE